MLKKIFLSNLFLFLLFSGRAFAGEYILPYPSYMPGNKLYRIAQIIDFFAQYWNWGSIAQIRFHMGLSDKFLVEAKTLFEYKQYLLAQRALDKSNTEIEKVPLSFSQAAENKEDVTKLHKTFEDELRTHQEVLEKVKSEVPIQFNWTPEKQTATTIPIHDKINAAITIRQKLQ